MGLPSIFFKNEVVFHLIKKLRLAYYTPVRLLCLSLLENVGQAQTQTGAIKIGCSKPDSIVESVLSTELISQIFIILTLTFPEAL